MKIIGLWIDGSFSVQDRGEERWKSYDENLREKKRNEHIVANKHNDDIFYVYFCFHY